MTKKLLALSVFAVGYVSLLFGQVSAGVGALTGLVLDPSGSPIAHAHVVVENSRFGIHRDLATTDGGVFNAPSLVPGPGYSVTISASGFSKFERRDITVNVGRNVDIRVGMEIAGSSTMINVNEAAELIENKTDVSQNITQRQIDHLPINGRRVDSFVLLTPGVTNDGTFGLLSFRGIPGGNNFMTDGNDTTETFYNENAGRTRIPTQISQDAVQEFQVLSDSYSAEYGRALGGVVNTVTRSGTNDLHGTAYWFFRNRTLDARDPFATFNPPEYRHQVGGTISGPIVKDKVFYLFNTEEQIRNFPLVSSIINPAVINSMTQTWNNCGVALGGLPAATPAQCQAVNGTLNRFYQTIPRTGDQQTGLGKIDIRPNDANSISLSFNYQHFNSPNGIQTGASVTSGGALNSNGIDDVGVRYGRAQWTYAAKGNMVNEARFGWFKDRQSDSINDALLDPTFGPLSVSVNGQSIGGANYLPRIQPSESRYEAADNFSYSVGKHNLKFGVDYFWTEDYTNQLINGNASYSFPNANAFALAYSGPTAGTIRTYTSYQQGFGTRAVDAVMQDLNFYAQDQYRLTSSLTLYYGLRYEHTFLPKPPMSNPSYPQTGRIPADNVNLAPRVGFAWNVAKDTVIRSGYGIYYARYPGAMINSMFTTNNLYQQSLTIQTTDPTQAALGPMFPFTLTSPAGTSGAATVGFAAPNLRTPYSQQADFSVQHAFGPHTSVTASYMWSRAAQMFTVRDLNMGTPASSLTYNVLNTSGAVVSTYTTPVYLTANRIDPRFSRILEVDNGGDSFYNGLALQMQRRFANGFEASLSYTWSHAIDYNMGNAGANLFLSNNAPTTLFNGDYRGVKSDSSLDQRHRVVVNWIWSPTFTHRSDVWSRFLVNNWQLSGISTIATGQPLTESLTVSTPLSATQVRALGLPSNLAFTSTLNGFGGSTQVPWIGVNTMRLPMIHTVDARLSKILPITERYKLTLNFEAFNLTNTTYYTALATRAYTANGLNISPANGFGTPTATAGFPDGTNARRAQASIRFDF
jgi:outer membrane receptor protein involved in Fe transport